MRLATIADALTLADDVGAALERLRVTFDEFRELDALGRGTIWHRRLQDWRFFHGHRHRWHRPGIEPREVEL